MSAFSSSSRPAQAEDEAAHAPQPARLKLEAYREEEENHTELGDAHRPFDLVHQAEPVRSDERAGDQVPEHRAEPIRRKIVTATTAAARTIAAVLSMRTNRADRASIASSKCGRER